MTALEAIALIGRHAEGMGEVVIDLAHRVEALEGDRRNAEELLEALHGSEESGSVAREQVARYRAEVEAWETWAEGFLGRLDTRAADGPALRSELEKRRDRLRNERDAYFDTIQDEREGAKLIRERLREARRRVSELEDMHGAAVKRIAELAKERNEAIKLRGERDRYGAEAEDLEHALEECKIERDEAFALLERVHANLKAGRLAGSDVEEIEAMLRGRHYKSLHDEVKKLKGECVAMAGLLERARLLLLERAPNPDGEIDRIDQEIRDLFVGGGSS